MPCRCSDCLAEDADFHCSVDCVGGHWRGLPAAITACVDHTRLVGHGLNLFHVPLPHDAGHEVGIHGLGAAGIHVSNLEEAVAVAPGTTFTVDALTDPPLFVGGFTSYMW